jgi:SET domain-containing protein
MGLIIRSSTIHAAGCYTTTAIRKGSRVAEYTGPRLSKDEADACYDNLPITYLFGLGDGSVVIDGHCMAMFINHSCDPNCETHERKGRVWIKAIRDIAPGEEITYDYCLYDGDQDEATCNCGAPKCRGTMYSEDEVRKRDALAKKAARRNNPNDHLTKVNGTRVPSAPGQQIAEP